MSNEYMSIEMKEHLKDSITKTVNSITQSEGSIINGYALIEALSDAEYGLANRVDTIKIGDVLIRKIEKITHSKMSSDLRYKDSSSTTYYCYTKDDLNNKPNYIEEYDPGEFYKCSSLFEIRRGNEYRCFFEEDKGNSNHKGRLAIYLCTAGGGRKSKLTNEQKTQLIDDYSKGISKDELMTKYNLSSSTLYRILTK